MAKRKTKNTKIKNVISICVLILGIASLVTLFLPVVYMDGMQIGYTGLQISFGHTVSTVGGIVQTKVFDFSILNTLTYVLAIVGIVFYVLGNLGKGTKFATLISALAFLASGVLFFMQNTICIPSFLPIELIALNYGAYLGAVASILAGTLSLSKLVIK